MLFPNVKEVVSEFLPSWNISRSVDLCDSGQSWNNFVPLKVSGDLFDRNYFSSVVYLYFMRHESARFNETHITMEDVPELRQFVHRRRTQHAAYFRNAGIVGRR